MDQNRKEYIQKLKRELETVESRFYKSMDHSQMIMEDYISRAAKNWLDFNLAKFKYHETLDELTKTKETLEEKLKIIESKELSIRNLEMTIEEYYCHYAYTT